MIDRAFWAGRRVFLTGHTGFKGAWASMVLRFLGAEVHGFALPPDDERNLFVVGDVEAHVRHHVGDVRDLGALRRAVADAQPEIVIHMAAQALVRRSYAEPVETYATNVMGTVNLLDSVRHTPNVQAVIVVTSDKCYENVGWVWGYREADPLGGHDPYSNSKGCTELVTDSFRRSFFQNDKMARIASGRAGNVIGGGDWSRDRLVPDAMRAFIAGKPLAVRQPDAVRPWQHVLDPIMGYLTLAERLVRDGRDFATAWNFGPSAASEVRVEYIVDSLADLWGGSARWERNTGSQPHEAACLKLDCSKALTRLNWRPLIDLDDALKFTVEWYRAFDAGEDMRRITLAQIEKLIAPNEVRSAA